MYNETEGLVNIAVSIQRGKYMDITTITTAYEGLKLGKELLKSLHEAKVESDAKVKIEEVMQKLGGAQDTLFSMREELFKLQTENENLKKKINETDAWEQKISNYELVKTSGGAVVYQFKETPEHYICPSCVSNCRTEILHDNRTFSGKYRCVKCEAEYPINPKSSPPTPGVVRSRRR